MMDSWVGQPGFNLQKECFSGHGYGLVAKERPILCLFVAFS